MTGNAVSAPSAVKPRISRSMAYKVRGDGYVEVYDLDFAAYCGMRNLVIAEAIETDSSTNRRRQYLFVFNDPTGRIANLSIDYMNSESAKHADWVRRMKKGTRSIRQGSPEE